MGFPLEGVRIISVEQYGAGPFGTMQLADLGAEIIKIENAAEGGDVGRHVRHPDDPLPQGDSMFHQAFNHIGKTKGQFQVKPEAFDCHCAITPWKVSIFTVAESVVLHIPALFITVFYKFMVLPVRAASARASSVRMLAILSPAG